MEETNEKPEGLEVRTYFVRGRNALVARADFGELYVDYYLHLGRFGYRHAPEYDHMLKEALAALTLHCASRPWNEETAWTFHFTAPLVNLFVTGDNRRGAVVGQLFTENVKEDGLNVLKSDLVRGDARRGFERRRSEVDLLEPGIFRAVERYYEQSEQRPARLFQHGDEDFVMVSAHPDCDMAWFESLTDEKVCALDQTEELSLLERRYYRWECGCNEQRMMEVLAPAFQQSPEDLFGEEAALRMSCPRCGAWYAITREAMEAFVAKK